MKSLLIAFRQSERGSALVEVAVTLPVLLLLLVGVIDIGRGYYFALEVSDAAEAGALYGSLNTSDTAGMRSAATLDAPDLPGGLTTNTASSGCECPDGSGIVSGCASPPGACSTTYVRYVQVNTAYTYHPMLPYPGIPATYSLTGLAVLRASQ